MTCIYILDYMNIFISPSDNSYTECQVITQFSNFPIKNQKSTLLTWKMGLVARSKLEKIWKAITAIHRRDP